MPALEFPLALVRCSLPLWVILCLLGCDKNVAPVERRVLVTPLAEQAPAPTQEPEAPSEPACAPLGLDQDGDGEDDACDEDLDGDGVDNGADNCPGMANPEQTDANDNGVGDRCDRSLDKDLDGVPDKGDNCVEVANPNQIDRDKDGLGDVCDHDLDGDRVHNDRDNCSRIYNPEQKDRNGNTIGDKCERKECVGNVCGGCGELPVVIDDACGACEGGQWACTTRETVECRCP